MVAQGVDNIMVFQYKIGTWIGVYNFASFHCQYADTSFVAQVKLFDAFLIRHRVFVNNERIYLKIGDA